MHDPEKPLQSGIMFTNKAGAFPYSQTLDLVWKGVSGTNTSLLKTVVIYDRIQFHNIEDLEPHSQHFIFFITYKLAKYARIFEIGKHFSLV
jgi:hypothetical protein